MVETKTDVRDELVKKMESYRKNKSAIFSEDGSILPQYQHLQAKFDSLKHSVFALLKEYIYEQIFSYLLVKNDENGRKLCDQMTIVVNSRKEEFNKQLESGDISDIDSIIESIKDSVINMWVPYTMTLTV